MRPLTLLATALATNAVVRAQNASHASQVDDNNEAFLPGLLDSFGLNGNEYLGFHKRLTGMLEQRATTGYTPLSTRFGKCLDVPSGNAANGQKPQLWDCVSGSANQNWKTSSNTLRTTNNACIDVPGGVIYSGAPVQFWACDANNRNQWFEVAGNSIRKKNTNFCLDVKDGHYDNGGGIQLWACDYNAQGNQVFTFGAVPSTAQSSASTFLGYATISMDKFAQLHPECAPYKDAFNQAAAAMNLVPALLAAIAETESSCNPNVPYGITQWMDDGAWAQYSTPGANRMVASDAIWATARYIRALLNQDNQNLDNALRDYNGPIWQGGSPTYQSDIRVWMSGGSVW